MSEKRNHISTSGNVLNDLKLLFERKVFVLLGGLVLFLVILFMPLPEGMTISGKRLLAIVALMACWWIGEGTAIAVTALLPLVLFPLMGIMSSKQVAPNYANHFVFLFSLIRFPLIIIRKRNLLSLWNMRFKPIQKKSNIHLSTK